jgi:hypothetical protein
MAAGPAFGGFITYTTVTREGIETDVIHEWPDYVGRHIDGGKPGLGIDGINHCPSPGERLTTSPQPAAVHSADASP